MWGSARIFVDAAAGGLASISRLRPGEQVISLSFVC